jgi:hypothetical protein
VRGLLTILKKLFFWNYARNTWQWDVLCVVILVFIFLTPRTWFSGGERVKAADGERATAGMHQSRITTVVLSPEVVTNETDKGQIQEIVKRMTGRTEVEVQAVRRIVGTDGKTLSFEVDIQ